MGFDAKPLTPEELGHELRELMQLRELLGTVTRELAARRPCREVEHARMFAQTSAQWVKEAERRIAGELMGSRQRNFDQEEGED